MRVPPVMNRFADGRLHLQHGPIDLIIEAFGTPRQVDRAYAATVGRFTTVLDELCEELQVLRSGTSPNGTQPTGIVAQRMWQATAPFATDLFITPMAAVAGSVAEEILSAMTRATVLRKAYINNGGDIALALAPSESFAIGMIDRPDRPGVFGTLDISADQPVRGIATSGWRGRSFSLGIADAVTVLADTASQADAAATVIANAVDILGHPSIIRRAATDMDPQSDLDARLVTVDVGPLSAAEVDMALRGGFEVAESCRRRHLIRAAALNLCGQTVLVDGKSASFAAMAAE